MVNGVNISVYATFYSLKINYNEEPNEEYRIDINKIQEVKFRKYNVL